MVRFTQFAATAVILLIACVHASAREWRDSQGRSFKGELIRQNDNVAVLQRGNRIHVVPLGNFSGADQEYLRSIRDKKREQVERRQRQHKWKDATGNYSVEAEFASLSDDQVLLKKLDDTEIRVALTRLSVADQEYVRTTIQERENRRRQLEERRLGSARGKILSALVAHWYAKQRKVSVNDLLNGRGPRSEPTFAEAVVNALAYNVRDAQLQSAIQDLVPEATAAETTAMKVIVVGYIEGKAAEDIERDAVKAWAISRLQEELNQSEPLPGHMMSAVEFLASVHAEWKKRQLPKS